MEKKEKLLRMILTAATVLLLVLLAWQCLDIYLVGNSPANLDENGLYIHQRAWETEIRAEYTGQLDQVCEDSCMEFFLCPVPEDGRYFNIEFNPNGCVYLGFGSGRNGGVRLINDIKSVFSVKTARLEDGWEIYYTIPLSFLKLFYPGYTLEAGRVITANCYKCGDKTVAPHYLLWNPSTSPVPDYHRPQDFGEMTLG